MQMDIFEIGSFLQVFSVTVRETKSGDGSEVDASFTSGLASEESTAKFK